VRVPGRAVKPAGTAGGNWSIGFQSMLADASLSAYFSPVLLDRLDEVLVSLSILNGGVGVRGLGRWFDLAPVRFALHRR